METSKNQPDQNDQANLRPDYLSFPEVLAQSIANIGPSATPAFVIPLVFASAGNGTWFAYLAAALGLTLVSLNINQFARRTASAGSLYVYIARGLGPVAGVISGWALVIAYLFTATAVVIGFANYGNVLLGTTNSLGVTVLLAAVGAGLAWWVAYRDIKLSAELMLWIELGSVLLIVLLAIIVLTQHGFQIDVKQFTLEGVSAENIRLGLVLAVFSFVGFESATALGDEAKNPLHSIPRAVLGSVSVPGLFFVLLAYTQVLGFRTISTTLDKDPSPLGTLATNANVGFFGWLISVGAALSFFACVLASINAASRILFALSRHGIIHNQVGNAHQRNATPHVAITLTAILSFAIPVAVLVKGVGVFDAYAYLGTIATFGFLVVYILISIAAPVYLRRIQQLKPVHVGISVVSILFLLIPLAGSLYPIPAPPYNLLPYGFLALLLAGVVWFFLLWQRSPQLIATIERDLESSHAQYSALSGSDGLER